jgi:hypothetical protein
MGARRGARCPTSPTAVIRDCAELVRKNIQVDSTRKPSARRAAGDGASAAILTRFGAIPGLRGGVGGGKGVG